ncbi:LAQU0S02e03774g1_1 [Lachancea quebecensis]|uniref:LAQU0S02e03774g1_1 n=1 Tax=Lachancea quebecensis TaxID=1654605 RepID=A0A0P1KMD3_9SACH|nr:LAQU0S02e03774g1_1 [Lachancea quebecensis]
MRAPLREFLKNNVLLLDGGQGTELEKKGVSISHPLWSTLPFITKNKTHLEAIKEMYCDFTKAGSNALMTITYQASFSSMKKYSEGRVKSEEDYAAFLDYVIDFTDHKCITPDKYLVGSIGPYAGLLSNGAEYSGYYGEDNIDFIDYYRPQVKHFALSPRIDLIGIETVPNINELKALLSPEFSRLCCSKPYYISITTDSDGCLRDGTSLNEICHAIKLSAPLLPTNFIFFAVNCIEFLHCAEILKSLNNRLEMLGLDKRFRFRGAYPNSGEIYHGDTHSWSNSPHADPQETWEKMTLRLLDQKCLMIGGCCRTGPKEIHQMSLATEKSLNSYYKGSAST